MPKLKLFNCDVRRSAKSDCLWRHDGLMASCEVNCSLGRIVSMFRGWQILALQCRCSIHGSRLVVLIRLDVLLLCWRGSVCNGRCEVCWCMPLVLREYTSRSRGRNCSGKSTSTWLSLAQDTLPYIISRFRANFTLGLVSKRKITPRLTRRELKIYGPWTVALCRRHRHPKMKLFSMTSIQQP